MCMPCLQSAILVCKLNWSIKETQNPEEHKHEREAMTYIYTRAVSYFHLTYFIVVRIGIESYIKAFI